MRHLILIIFVIALSMYACDTSGIGQRADTSAAESVFAQRLILALKNKDDRKIYSMLELPNIPFRFEGHGSTFVIHSYKDFRGSQLRAFILSDKVVLKYTLDPQARSIRTAFTRPGVRACFTKKCHKAKIKVKGKIYHYSSLKALHLKRDYRIWLYCETEKNCKILAFDIDRWR